MSARVYVRVLHESQTLDERTGEPFRWTHVLDERTAEEHVRMVHAGEYPDLVGVRARVEGP